MSEIIPFEQYQKRAAPPLVFVDMLQEQLDASEGFGAQQTGPALAKCKLLLEEARSRHWPVAFVRSPACAVPGKASARWIRGFEPRRTDMIFDRTGASCYSSEEFASAMDDAGRVFVVAGFSVESACLATFIDASQNNHFVGLVRDASATRPFPGRDAGESHDAAVTVASRFGTIVTAEHWIKVASRTAEPAAQRSNVSRLR